MSILTLQNLKVNLFLNIPVVDNRGCVYVPMSRPESWDNLSPSKCDCGNGSETPVKRPHFDAAVLPAKRSISTIEGRKGADRQGVSLGSVPAPLLSGAPDPLVYLSAHISTNFNLVVNVYERDTVVKIKKTLNNQAFKSRGGGKRERITEYSKGSKRRLMFLVRNTENLWVGGSWIDLTYPEGLVPMDGRVAKKHLRAFLKVLERLDITANIWVNEFQERKAVHFHLLCNKHVHYKDVELAWDKIIGNNWRARGEKHSASTSVGLVRSKNQLYYRVIKYLSKQDQKIVPVGYENVGRFWGSTRGLLVPVRTLRQVGAYYMICLITRLIRKWYDARLRLLQGRRFRWSGFSFTAYDGSRFMNSMRL